MGNLRRCYQEVREERRWHAGFLEGRREESRSDAGPESFASQPVKTDILPFGSDTLVLIPKSGCAIAATSHVCSR